ncbi:hypothetical protein [Williamsia sp. DF01-3]|uniref:hypothetical protein n=1 Tax=Williamsia sp. DF01-3 TaxID=2934157 RepID=UPI000DB1B4DB|nr:hypothetical protein [Williamsia sp. DF01-3]MCK0515761.1 hypothetical protein [Williamsia sp. DF01-3]PZU02012.1 MAG: hypothetical protein DI630_10050 [Gordonia sp. (in: high G+C Gram-positive bacteria)]
MTTSNNTTSRLRRNSIRAATIVGVAALAWLTSAGIAGAEAPGDAVVLAATWNPLDGITPDFSLWGTGVGDTWRRLMAAFWAACLAVCTIWVIAASVKMAMANRRGMAGQQVEAKASFMDAVIGFGACAGSSIVIGGVLFAVSG